LSHSSITSDPLNQCWIANREELAESVPIQSQEEPDFLTKMSSSELTTYQLQLQQVEVALTTEPDNQELVKLKADLEQVIDLTKELIAQQVKGSGNNAEEQEASTSSSSSSSSKKHLDTLQPVKHWQVGERCQALYDKDGLYHEATIAEITTDNEVSVTFKHNHQTGVTHLGLLKISSKSFANSTAAVTRRENQAKERERLKKRKAKKAERMKELEQEGEREKNKWQNFNSKAFGKKGVVKKSIFKTPENAQGRVGVGTCGVSGQEMTKYTVGEKHIPRKTT